MITGGYKNKFCLALDSTEILDIEDGSVTMACSMNSRRAGHGMGVITINGEDKIAVIGGYDGTFKLDSVEFYNTQTQKWEMTDIKLNEPTHRFGFLSVKLSDMILHL